MKRITLSQLMNACSNLETECFMFQVTSANYPLQTAHTEVLKANRMLFEHDSNKERLINIMSRYSTFFKKAWLYVSDEIYIKYF